MVIIGLENQEKYEKYKKYEIFVFDNHDPHDYDNRLQLKNTNRPEVHKCVVFDPIASPRTVYRCPNNREPKIHGPVVDLVQMKNFEPWDICELSVYGIVPGKSHSTMFILYSVIPLFLLHHSLMYHTFICVLDHVEIFVRMIRDEYTQTVMRMIEIETL